MRRIGVLISGRGTNLQALIAGTQSNQIPGKIVCVVSNKPQAFGIQRAKQANISTEIIPHKNYSCRQDHEKEIIRVLETHSVELVVLAGYMRLLTPFFINHYPSAIINIHPSLLPSFKGVHSQRQALEYGVKITGCTVHFVDTEMDQGPIIIQRPVKILDSDTEETLSEKILKQEHEALIEATRLWCQNKIQITDRRVIIMEE